MYLKSSIFLALLFSCSFAFAQERTASPEIYEVKSFGFWEADDYEGHFRIVIINQGFEHVSSNVYLEWISSNNESLKIIKSVLITEVSEFYSVSIKTTNLKKVVLKLVDSHSFEKKKWLLTSFKTTFFKACR